ncbi:MAG: type IVB secretion system protein IcmV [Legionellales bacterium]
MKKNTEPKVKKIASRIFKVRTWADWDRTKSFTVYLIDGIKSLFVPNKAEAVESFEEAKVRLNLTDAELDVKQKALFRLAMIMVGAAGLIFVYMGYQLFYGSFKAVVVSLIVMMLALALAFRYHFWYFQIKNHKLGCTLQEWYKQGLMGEKK